MLLFVTEYKSA